MKDQYTKSMNLQVFTKTILNHDTLSSALYYNTIEIQQYKEEELVGLTRE